MSSPRPSKRQRICRACDQCRCRKSKCDGEQPVCAICRSANRPCTYQKGGGRRGLPSGYVRSLEIILGLIVQHIPNSEATIHSILREYRDKGNFLTSDVAENSLSVWRKSKLSRDLSQLFAPGSGGLAHDESEGDSVKTRDHENIDDQGSPPSIPRLNEIAVVCDATYQTFETQSLSNWTIPDNTPDLLDFYFTYTHCWFPILERHELLRAMHVSSSQLTPDVTSSRMLLWSVIIYSCAMKGTLQPRLPTLPAIQLYIQRPLFSELGRLELRHIQSTLIIILIHVAKGNINQAWLLLGQAARMLATLPLAKRKGRFTHTFNGCVFLDNIVSALLNKTSCLSQKEQLQQGPVEEDDVDEWDMWPASRAKTPAAPLQALSTFNSVRRLTQNLSQISYYTSNTSNNPNFEDLLDNLRQQQAGILRDRPYNQDGHATPPLFTLHLTSAFTTLSLICKLEKVSPAILDLCIRTINHSLDMLDHYVDMTGGTGSSPLVPCFALRCEQSLGIMTSVLSSTEKKVLETRVHRFLSSVKLNGCLEGGNWFQHASASVSATGIDPHNTFPIPIPVTYDTLASHVDMASLESLREPPDITLPDLPSASEATGPAGIGGQEEYDALFEEMMLVSSLSPSRYAAPITLCLFGFQP